MSLTYNSGDTSLQSEDIILQGIRSIDEEAEQRRGTPAATDTKNARGFRFPLEPKAPVTAPSLKASLRSRIIGLRKLYDHPRIGYILKTLAVVARLPTRFEQVYRDHADLRDRLAALIHELDTVDTHRGQLLARVHLLEGSQKALQEALADLFARQERLAEVVQSSLNQSDMALESDTVDAFYLAFENRHRGSREAIREKQQEYLPYLAKLPFLPSQVTCLDVGCGRGEWLELLIEKGYQAAGIDLNASMVESCKERGLNVVRSDVLAYLGQLADNSLAVISGFHVVEHLPFPIALKWIREAKRVLKPGGMLLLETPNPENLTVGSCNFYSDPTHRNPIPPVTLHFMMEYCGMVNATIHRLTPMPMPAPMSKAVVKGEGVGEKRDSREEDLVGDMAKRIYGPQDYAAIAFKALV